VSKVFIALSANVGNKQENISQAISYLKTYVSNMRIANVYMTKPMYHEKQDNFLNSVIQGYTKLSSEKLLHITQGIEKKIGRVRRFRNGPREVDIDILFYDNSIIERKNLIIPHPKVFERDFVLQPLVDLEPDFVHPVLKKTMKELLEEIPSNKKTIVDLV